MLLEEHNVHNNDIDLQHNCCIVQGTLYALFMHDAIYLYARLVNMMLARGMDYRNGSAMFELARTVEFNGSFFVVA